MYSLTIHFGPNAMSWALLFKDKERAFSYYSAYETAKGRNLPGRYILEDDFGQHLSLELNSVHGILLEDLDLVEEARILRSLANARGEVKARQRAATDPTIRQAQQGPSVLQPRFNG
jgi:hypothetical protein